MAPGVFSAIDARVFDSVDTLTTPVVLIDLDVVDNNLSAFASLACDLDVSVRSHVKAHKIPAIARRQLEVFDGGVLCQTLSEAEVMVQHGIDDILLVCPVVSDRKLDRLFWVAGKTQSFATVVDCPGNIAPLHANAEAHDTCLDVVLEIDVGMERMGVQPGKAAVPIAEEIDELPYLTLVGILGHDGHVSVDDGSVAEYERAATKISEELRATQVHLRDVGIHIEDVISGATRVAHHIPSDSPITELDPGRYVFNDVGMFHHRHDITKADCAATVLTTVISKPTDDRAIVDAGSKTLGYGEASLPLAKHRNDIEFYRKSSEHGFVDTSTAEEPVSVGDTIEFIVPNIYAAVNIHEQFIGVRDNRVTDLLHVAARGMDQ